MIAQEMSGATQVLRPWQTVARTLFQAALAVAVAVPQLYAAIQDSSPILTTSAVTTFVGVCAAITRVMAIPGVNAWLNRHVPWLGAGE